jgi:gliding motility-associated-like protein
LCFGQCLVIGATGTAITYIWDNGALQGQQYCPSDTTMFHVTGTDVNFCQNTDSILVNYSLELPPVVNAGPDDAICFSESYTLTATGDADVYIWNNNVTDGQSFTPSQTNTYVVIGTDVQNGCIASDTMELVVNPLPVVTISTPDSILCAGETAVLTANGAVNYQWTNGPSTQVYSFIPTVTADYEVVGYDINGCTDTADITVIVNPLPIPLFSSDMNFGGCLPFSPTFTDQTGVNGNGPASASVLWDFGNGSTSNQTGSVMNIYDNYGCYDITLTSTTSEGCSATLTQQDYVCVNEIIASFTPDVTEQLISDPCFEFTNNSVNATSFQWFFGDGEESDFVSTNHCFDSIGCYPVTLVAYTQDGCTDSVVQVVCIKDQLIIYVPNAFTPDGDGLNEVFLPILTAGYKPGTYELNIYNRWGERIFSTQEENTGWDGTYLGNQVQIGTYTYTIKLKDSMSNKVYTFDGRISLIR